MTFGETDTDRRGSPIVIGDVCFTSPDRRYEPKGVDSPLQFAVDRALTRAATAT